jgi:GH15 family glucan-1,4-alpha-glucosidase
MTNLPEVTGVITAREVAASAESIAALQQPSGMIPWHDGGHCDPWNHVETAMALDVAGLHARARAAYRWLADAQSAEGWWSNYYRADGTIEDAKLDTNVCAYVAAGVWHHALITRDLGFCSELWPVVVSALDWVLSEQRADGAILWARHVDHRPWEYALLTGSSSIWHALHCGTRLAKLVGSPRPDWEVAAARLGEVIRARPEAFEPKERWAMDWYYPVLTGALRGEPAKARLAEQWDRFVMDGLGVRCVSDEAWVTAAETAECALAHAAIGDLDTACDLLRWTRAHRADDGSYFTGVVHPERVTFPGGERTAYTAAAVILAADAISGASAASGLFLPGES